MARVLRRNSINAISVKNCGLQTLGDGTCIAWLAGSDSKNGLLLARVFQDKYHRCDCSEKNSRGSDMDLTRRRTEGKPCEIAWGELHWEGTDGRRRKVGNRQGGRKGSRGK